MISQFDLGWLVAILEGEGYFGYTDRNHRVAIGMIDRDTIDRVAYLMSKVLERHIPITSQFNKSGSEHFKIQINSRNARAIMQLVVPHMSYRRRKKIWQCLNKYREPKPEGIVTAEQMAKGALRLIVNKEIAA